MDNIIIQIIGLLLIIFREALARIAVQSQNNAWHYRFGEREVQGTKHGHLFIGFLLVATPVFWGEQRGQENYVQAAIGLLAALVAWKLSASRPIAEPQKSIVVRPSTLPRIGNSPIYFVLIVLALATFATIIVGQLFWNWY